MKKKKKKKKKRNRPMLINSQIFNTQKEKFVWFKALLRVFLEEEEEEKIIIRKKNRKNIYISKEHVFLCNKYLIERPYYSRIVLLFFFLF